MHVKAKKSRIFISHAEKDAVYAKAIVELLEDIGLGKNEMICTSVNGYKIPLGEKIYDYLAKQFLTYNLHVIFVLSENYYNSAASLNEMGAAWMCKHRYDVILLPDMRFEDVRGCIDKTQIAIKLDSEEEELRHRLNELKMNILKEFAKPDMELEIWERKRGDFLEKIKNLMKEESERKDADARKACNRALEESLSCMAEILLAYATEERGRISIIRNSGKIYIHAGIWDFTGEKTSPRAVKQWEAAVGELLRMHLIKRIGKRDQIYEVTKQGYEAADNIKNMLEFDGSVMPDVYLYDFQADIE